MNDGRERKRFEQSSLRHPKDDRPALYTLLRTHAVRQVVQEAIRQPSPTDHVR